MGKDTFRTLAMTAILLWLGLILAPVVMAAEAWHKIEHPSLDFLFADAAGPHLAYQNIYLEPVSVWYPDAANLASEQAEALQRRAEAFFRTAFSAHGFTVLDQPVAGSVIAHIELIDLKGAPITAELLDWARRFRFRVQPGRMTLVAELRDAATGRVLVRMADLEELTGDTQVLWLNVDRALESWGEVVAANVLEHSNEAALANVQR